MLSKETKPGTYFLCIMNIDNPPGYLEKGEVLIFNLYFNGGYNMTKTGNSQRIKVHLYDNEKRHLVELSEVSKLLYLND